jgi:glycine/D-amino acid oxidase-like deaminating enzyme
MGPHVAVVGAGILGAALARALAVGGARVTLVESREAPGGVATPRSWAWINASWGHPEAYVRLRMRSMAEWRRWGAEVPGLAPDWAGCLLWDLPEPDLRAFVAERQGQGYAIRLVDGAEAAGIEPALAAPPALAAHAAEEGAVEPEAAARAMAADAMARGAVLRAGGAVAGLVLEGGRVVGLRLSGGEAVAADAVVLAAGTATPALAAEAGVRVPLDAPAGLLAWTGPLPPLLRGLVVSPGLELRQRADGSLFGSADFAGMEPGQDARATAEGVVATIRERLRGAEGAVLGGWSVGHRPVPGDGLPVAGEAAPGLWLCVTHSGVTLAPGLAALLSRAILTGESDPLLAPFGPGRFG